MNTQAISNQFLANINAQPTAASVPTHARAAAAQCSTQDEFCARFWGAPDWILDRLAAVLWNANVSADNPDGSRLFIWPCTWVGALRKLKAADKEAKTFAAEHPVEAARFPAFEDLRAAFVRGKVEIGDGPKTINWDYEDDHPGEYTDSAYTRSAQPFPGVWRELKHGLNGTRKWTIVLRA